MSGTFAPDDTVPGVGRVESTRSAGLLGGGLFTFAIAYAPSAYVGIASPRGADRVLLLPVFGPWIALAGRPTCTPPKGSEVLPVDPCIEETLSRAALITAGSLQGLGAVLIAFGLPARAEIVPDRDRGVIKSLSVVPVFNASSSGLSATGRF